MHVIARLVALVSRSRVRLTRFHGVFALNSTHRAQVTPAKRGKGSVRAIWLESAVEFRIKNAIHTTAKRSNSTVPLLCCSGVNSRPKICQSWVLQINPL